MNFPSALTEDAARVNSSSVVSPSGAPARCPTADGEDDFMQAAGLNRQHVYGPADFLPTSAHAVSPNSSGGKGDRPLRNSTVPVARVPRFKPARQRKVRLIKK